VLDDYMESQDIPYTLLKNSVVNNKLSHAYLIDGSNYEKAFDFVMAFVKLIICNNHYSNNNLCSQCNICRRIDDGNYTDVKIIESDSLVIKKEQLMDLQNSFSLTSLEGNKRVYVIKDCEKMNKQASNSLLKFLEEPCDNIIAILFTNNVSSLLSTIISRCQVIKLNNNKVFNNKAVYNFASIFCSKKEDIDFFVNDESKSKMIDDVISFIKYYEENGLDSLIYVKKLCYNIFSSREDSLMGISLVLNFYNDVLRYKFGLDNYFYQEYIYLIEDISNRNSLNKILNKIELCYNKYSDLKYNLNVNLLIDDLIIRMGECDECS